VTNARVSLVIYVHRRQLACVQELMHTRSGNPKEPGSEGDRNPHKSVPIATLAVLSNQANPLPDVERSGHLLPNTSELIRNAFEHTGLLP
jgi:hypothetical protein